MIAGHFATALIPYQLQSKSKAAPFWLYLVASQFLDFLMLGLTMVGLEKLSPADFFEASFSSMHSEMLISHDIIPVIGWSILFALVVFLFFKNKMVAIWCLVLMLLHEVFDLLVGFEHFIFGLETSSLGLNLYQKAPTTGLIIEALLCGIIIFWFCGHRERNGQSVSNRLKIGLSILLVGSTLLTILIANQSINSWLGW